MAIFKWKKYKGYEEKYVAQKDPKYFKWCLSKGYKTSDEIITLVNDSLPDYINSFNSSNDEQYDVPDYKKQTYGTYNGKSVTWSDLTGNQRADISNANFKGYSLTRGRYID